MRLLVQEYWEAPGIEGWTDEELASAYLMVRQTVESRPPSWANVDAPWRGSVPRGT
jgi:hypothetical protein